MNGGGAELNGQALHPATGRGSPGLGVASLHGQVALVCDFWVRTSWVCDFVELRRSLALSGTGSLQDVLVGSPLRCYEYVQQGDSPLFRSLNFLTVVLPMTAIEMPQWGTASSSDEEQLSQRVSSKISPATFGRPWFPAIFRTTIYTNHCISITYSSSLETCTRWMTWELALFAQVFLAAATWDLLFRSAALSWCACPEA